MAELIAAGAAAAAPVVAAVAAAAPVVAAVAVAANAAFSVLKTFYGVFRTVVNGLARAVGPAAKTMENLGLRKTAKGAKEVQAAISEIGTIAGLFVGFRLANIAMAFIDMEKALGPLHDLFTDLNEIFSIFGHLLAHTVAPAVLTLYRAFFSEDVVGFMVSLGRALGLVLVPAIFALTVATDLLRPVLGVLTAGLQWCGDVMETVYHVITTVAGGILGFFDGTFGPTINAVVSFLDATWARVLAGIHGFANSFTTVVSFIDATWARVLAGIHGFANSFNTVVSFIDATWARVLAGIQGFFESVRDITGWFGMSNTVSTSPVDTPGDTLSPGGSSVYNINVGFLGGDEDTLLQLARRIRDLDFLR